MPGHEAQAGVRKALEQAWIVGLLHVPGDGAALLTNTASGRTR
jgi:hypothetical protein